jgi:hypothetical protein
VVTIANLFGLFDAGHSITTDGNGNGIEDGGGIVWLPSKLGPQYKAITLMFVAPSPAPGGPLGWRIIWSFGGQGGIIPPPIP